MFVVGFQNPGTKKPLAGEAQGRLLRLSPHMSPNLWKQQHYLPQFYHRLPLATTRSSLRRPVRVSTLEPTTPTTQENQKMPLVSMRQLLDEAARGGYGVGAFNVNNMEQIQAIMEAARETSSPVIIQESRGARSYTNDLFLWHLMQAAVELYPEIPVALHLDHGNEPDTCFSAIDLGFTSVMMDGSLEADGKTPASFEYNVAVT
ncbi:class II fructose-bisphosphate aldolase, partial [Gaiella sp.]|uniref:class II fructose-bisphosphate aldolase n=1 Tax=Gaiella sp. TaxID=2663207 RepID=UPI0039835D27